MFVEFWSRPYIRVAMNENFINFWRLINFKNLHEYYIRFSQGIKGQHEPLFWWIIKLQNLVHQITILVAVDSLQIFTVLRQIILQLKWCFYQNLKMHFWNCNIASIASACLFVWFCGHFLLKDSVYPLMETCLTFVVGTPYQGNCSGLPRAEGLQP